MNKSQPSPTNVTIFPAILSYFLSDHSFTLLLVLPPLSAKCERIPKLLKTHVSPFLFPSSFLFLFLFFPFPLSLYLSLSLCLCVSLRMCVSVSMSLWKPTNSIALIYAAITFLLCFVTPSSFKISICQKINHLISETCSFPDIFFSINVAIILASKITQQLSHCLEDRVHSLLGI